MELSPLGSSLLTLEMDNLKKVEKMNDLHEKIKD